MNRSRAVVIARVIVVSICASCSSGSPGGHGASGSAGTGRSGAAGASAGASATGEAGASVAGTSGGVAGSTSAGTAGATVDGGAAGSRVDAGSAGGTSGTIGPSDAGAPDATSHGNKVLIYTKTTGFRHASIPAAAAAIAKAAAAAGLVTEQSEDTAKFDPATLAQYAAVVLVATSGEPFGTPGTKQAQTLVSWVDAGGGLVAIEDANHAYDDNPVYVGLMGGDFNGHSGYGPDTCYSGGDHPTNMKLPASFPVTDEIYYFSKFRADNQVVLRCGSDKRPISWVRQEGAGRIFYTALGHADASWTSPPLVDDHVLPALLWTMGRPVP